MKDRYQLLVFDWDGTLFDSIDWIVHSLQQAARDCAMAVPDDRAARAVIGLSLKQAMATLYPGATPEATERLRATYRQYYNARDITPDCLFEGTPRLLETLRSHGYTLAVATGKTRAGLDAALNGTGIGSLFHTTRCADETVSKPDPAMLHEIMDELRAPPQRTLMIGDSIHDLQMARNAGVDAAAVTCGANEHGELLELEPLVCVKAAADLLRWLT